MLKDVTNTATELQLYDSTCWVSCCLQDPVLERFQPYKGPVSGGSVVTITGTNLDFGSSVRVKMSEQEGKVVS